MNIKKKKMSIKKIIGTSLFFVLCTLFLGIMFYGAWAVVGIDGVLAVGATALFIGLLYLSVWLITYND